MYQAGSSRHTKQVEVFHFVLAAANYNSTGRASEKQSSKKLGVTGSRCKMGETFSWEVSGREGGRDGRREGRRTGQPTEHHAPHTTEQLVTLFNFICKSQVSLHTMTTNYKLLLILKTSFNTFNGL